MEEYSFENGKQEVSLVDYLGLDDEEQIEDSSGITQVCMDREVGQDPNSNHAEEHDRMDQDNADGNTSGWV